MRIVIITLGVAATLAACDGKTSRAAADAVNTVEAKVEKPFPQKGEYDVIHERGDGEREETTIWINADNREDFERQFARQDGSNCRDWKVEIGGGSFEASGTCDAHDGDITNIGESVHGTYTRDTVDLTRETVLWGSPIRESYSYRLRNR